MVEWTVFRTDTFSDIIKRHKKNGQLLIELNKKIKRLQENPLVIGGFLSGKLHGFKSTRLIGKYRLIFRINEKEKIVYLEAIDHRDFDYSRFGFLYD